MRRPLLYSSQPTPRSASHTVLGTMPRSSAPSDSATGNCCSEDSSGSSGVVTDGVRVGSSGDGAIVALATVDDPMEPTVSGSALVQLPICQATIATSTGTNNKAA